MNLEKMVEDFFETGREAARSGDPARLHAFRIAAKRLRYTLEIFQPDSARTMLKQLREVQTLLGDMNDAFVAERFLLNQPTLSRRALALPPKLHAEGLSHIARFRRLWPRKFSPRVRDNWLSAIRRSNP